MTASKTFLFALLFSLFGSAALSQVRGSDDNRELFTRTDSFSGVVLVPGAVLLGDGGWWRPRASNMFDFRGICEGEKFADAPVLTDAHCGATLVASNLILTSAHCAKPKLNGKDPNKETSARNLDQWCKGVRFVFGINTANYNKPHKVKDTLFNCASVVKDGWQNGKNYKGDFLIIRLDHAVPGVKPAQVRKSGIVRPDDSVYSVGAPMGIPLVKSSGKVTYVGKEMEGVSTNLDIFGGDSGGGVFNEKTGELEGIVATTWGKSRGLYYGPTGCRRWAKANPEPDSIFEEENTGEKWVTGAGIVPVEYFRADLEKAMSGAATNTPSQDLASPSVQETKSSN